MTLLSATVRVLVVDDSAVVRQLLASVLAQSGMHVDTARDAADAARQLGRAHYDALLLDVEMPGMNGLAFLERLMRERPMPVVVCSGHVRAGSDVAMRALAGGAIDVVAKPRLGAGDGRQMLRHLVDTVRAAARARVGARPAASGRSMAVAGRPSGAVSVPAAGGAGGAGGALELVVVGASTGGVEAIRTVLTSLPADSPPVAVVQHMPPGFTTAFARDLDRDCAVTVREATHGAPLPRGVALVAPGDRHLRIRRRPAGFVAELSDAPPVSRHRPSVDVLFESASIAAASAAASLGVLLTGMGDDGARGLLALRRAGATTIAQDEASCVVFGMPAAAIQLRAASRVLSLRDIAHAIRQLDAALAVSAGRAHS